MDATPKGRQPVERELTLMLNNLCIPLFSIELSVVLLFWGRILGSMAESQYKALHSRPTLI